MGAAFVFALLPLLNWLSSAIVSLVILRKGEKEGALVFAWAMLPIGAATYVVGDPSPVIALVSTAMLAYLLRVTVSWELTIVGAVVLSGIGSIVYEFTAADVLREFVEWYIDYSARIGDGLEAITAADARNVIMGFFAMGQAYALILILVLSRWWQSGMYNPGGFRQEFHQLRLSPAITTPLVLAMLVCVVFSDQLGRWLPLLSVPLIVGAIGFVHWFMGERKLGTQWAVIFYMLLLMLFQLVYPLLASLALMDSWLDLRKRWQTRDK